MFSASWDVSLLWRRYIWLQICISNFQPWLSLFSLRLKSMKRWNTDPSHLWLPNVCLLTLLFHLGEFPSTFWFKDLQSPQLAPAPCESLQCVGFAARWVSPISFSRPVCFKAALLSVYGQKANVVSVYENKHWFRMLFQEQEHFGSVSFFHS